MINNLKFYKYWFHCKTTFSYRRFIKRYSLF